MRSTVIALLMLLACVGTRANAQAIRDYVSIAVEAALYAPTADFVEHFGDATPFKYPELRALRDTLAASEFCAATGLRSPDILVLARAMSEEELQRCANNDVGPLSATRVGSISTALLALPKTGAPLALSSRQLFMAVAKWLPTRPATGGQAGTVARWVANPNRFWSDISPDLPHLPIVVLHPPEESPAMRILQTRVLAPACLAMLAAARAAAVHEDTLRCAMRRSDEAWRSIDEARAASAMALAAQPAAHLIARWPQGRDAAWVPARIDGAAPPLPSGAHARTADTSYRATIDVHLYVKRANTALVRGLASFAPALREHLDALVLNKGHDAGR
jgi:hypothetical protein